MGWSRRWICGSFSRCSIRTFFQSFVPHSFESFFFLSSFWFVESLAIKWDINASLEINASWILLGFAEQTLCRHHNHCCYYHELWVENPSNRLIHSRKFMNGLGRFSTSTKSEFDFSRLLPSWWCRWLLGIIIMILHFPQDTRTNPYRKFIGKLDKIECVGYIE